MHEPVRQGRLAEIKTINGAGQEVVEFVGSMRAWMSAYEGPVLASLVYINGQAQRL
jgi:hypothetical protein